MEYFSDKELGANARISETINSEVWNGIVAKVKALILNGAFGERFPNRCEDGHGISGTDEELFKDALMAEVPEVEWPIKSGNWMQNAMQDAIQNGHLWRSEKVAIPKTLYILDFIQFCYKHVSEPIKIGYHEYRRHHHLNFNAENGRQIFLEDINYIFKRNGLIYELQKSGDIIRLGPPVLMEQLVSLVFNTGDSDLDLMLERAIKKIFSPDPAILQEAIESLWDAWERLKSIGASSQSEKKLSISTLLDKVSFDERFREMIETEAAALTIIGNSFQIRHSEVYQSKINKTAHIEYLFYRLFSMITLIIKSK